MNVYATVEFGKAREFEWEGLSYRAPPLSFRVGLHLTVIVNALKESLDAGQSTAMAVRKARGQLVHAVHPKARRHQFLWRRRLFPKAEPVALLALLGWLVHVPDECMVPPTNKTGSPVTVDWLDNYAQFAKEFFGWLDGQGEPLSWSHYVLGVRHIAKARAREDLRFVGATSAMHSKDREFREWQAEMKTAAGWH